MELAIKNDTKIEFINSILPPIFSQLTIWKKENILENKQVIFKILNEFGTKWIMNVICLNEGKSYLLAKDLEVQNNMEKLFNKKFKNEILKLDSVWLRKEIIKLGLKF